MQNGPLTSRLQHLKVGDTVLIGKKPTGTLVADNLLPGKTLWMLSTGTGLAPHVDHPRPRHLRPLRQVILTHTCRLKGEPRTWTTSSTTCRATSTCDIIKEKLDTVLIGKKPTGTLVADNLLPGKTLWMLSTGTGLAPFMSIIRDPDIYDRFDKVILTHTCRLKGGSRTWTTSSTTCRATSRLGDIIKVVLPDGHARSVRQRRPDHRPDRDGSCSRISTSRRSRRKTTA